MSVISVSVVHYDTPHDTFAATLRSLGAAAAQCADIDIAVRVHVIVNGPTTPVSPRECEAWLAPATLVPHNGHGNLGYGRGNNLAIAHESSQLHLILNPDVTLEPDALLRAWQFLADHPECVCVTPSATFENGQRAYLAKRAPTVAVLALRGFAPPMLRRHFASALEHYEMRDQDYRQTFAVPIASGAFMMCRTDVLRQIGGFDPRYFLYFEDFDLSRRMRAVGHICYVPAVRIVHHGGHAARKGFTHVRYFAISALRYFLQKSL
jgi:GT2 family glycosyltransferase